MRETKIVPIKSEGRDKGKVFVITEMPAWAAEKWSYRLLLALARSGVDVKQIEGTGTAGLFTAGIMAMPMLDFRDAEPLLDEMMDHIKIQPDPSRNPNYTRPIVRTETGEGDDIEEVQTFVALRSEFLELHTRFFAKGMPSRDSTSGSTTTSQA